MLTFLDVARMVDATVMMGVLGTRFVSSSFTVPMAQIHRSSVFCNVLARAVACIRTAWTQLKVKEEKYVCSANDLCDGEDVIDDDVDDDDDDDD